MIHRGSPRHMRHGGGVSRCFCFLLLSRHRHCFNLGVFARPSRAAWRSVRASRVKRAHAQTPAVTTGRSRISRQRCYDAATKPPRLPAPPPLPALHSLAAARHPGGRRQAMDGRRMQCPECCQTDESAKQGNVRKAGNLRQCMELLAAPLPPAGARLARLTMPQGPAWLRQRLMHSRLWWVMPPKTVLACCSRRLEQQATGAECRGAPSARLAANPLNGRTKSVMALGPAPCTPPAPAASGD